MKAVSVQGRASTRFIVPEAWQPVRHLGTGAYATVAAFRAPDGRDFAVKKAERIFDHPVLALRTLREVRLLAHLRHPNVLRIHRVFIDGHDAYLCLEAMDGDLNQLIHGGKTGLADFQVQCVLYQVMRGLLCLQTAHVVHRDLKPGNILVRAGGEVKIADFGLSRAIDADEDGHDMAVLTEYVVTRYYRAPEVVLTATHYTYAVDMWSSGCILGEMLTRRILFRGDDPLDQIEKIVSVVGRQSHEDMAWIPRSSPSWTFVEKCNASTSREAHQNSLRWSGVNPLATELLGLMVRFDPSRRITADDALQHQYLGQFEAAGDPEVAAARMAQPVDWSFDRRLCFDSQGRPRPYEARRFRQGFLEACQACGEGKSPRQSFRGQG